MILCELIIYQELSMTSISIFFSMIIGFSIREVKINSILIILSIFIAFHLFSFVSILYYGYDLIPQYLYGESRHLVGVNTLIKIRPSGLYPEPSTLAINYIAISIILFLRKENYKYKNVLISLSILFSILTFSVISIVSVLILVSNYRHYFKSFFYKFIIAGGLSYFLYNFMTLFVLPKIGLYSDRGLDSYKRFELFYVMSENIGFKPVNFTKSGVALDNGPITYLILFCGVYAIPMIFYILKKSKNNLDVILILFTKISLTYPLLWLILKNNEGLKSRNSN